MRATYSSLQNCNFAHKRRDFYVHKRAMLPRQDHRTHTRSGWHIPSNKISKSAATDMKNRRDAHTTPAPHPTRHRTTHEPLVSPLGCGNQNASSVVRMTAGDGLLPQRRRLSIRPVILRKTSVRSAIQVVEKSSKVTPTLDWCVTSRKTAPRRQ